MNSTLDILVPTFHIKSKNDVGELSKQYFTVLSLNGGNYTLLIESLVLTNSTEALNYGYRLFKTYKGKFLLAKEFAIKVDTLNMALSKINNTFK